MPSKRLGPFRFGYFPNDERFLLPRFGVLNTHAEDAIASWMLAHDGECTVYANWLCLELAVRLKTRSAKGIRGALGGSKSNAE